MAVAVDVRPYVGQYIAQAENGEILTAAPTYVEVERKLRKLGYTEFNMPTIELIPEGGLQLL